ncbi:hypothetical protein AAMO2058_000933900 [Amorphochlora amoebiformis]
MDVAILDQFVSPMKLEDLLFLKRSTPVRITVSKDLKKLLGFLPQPTLCTICKEKGHSAACCPKQSFTQKTPRKKQAIRPKVVRKGEVVFTGVQINRRISSLPRGNSVPVAVPLHFSHQLSTLPASTYQPVVRTPPPTSLMPDEADEIDPYLGFKEPLNLKRPPRQLLPRHGSLPKVQTDESQDKEIAGILLFMQGSSAASHPPSRRMQRTESEPYRRTRQIESLVSPKRRRQGQTNLDIHMRKRKKLRSPRRPRSAELRVKSTEL